MKNNSEQILRKTITDKIEATTAVNGWGIGEWDEFITKKISEEREFNAQELEMTVIEYLLEFLGTDPITAQYCHKVGKYYIYNDKKIKWYFLSEEETQEATRKWKIQELININLEINNYRHHEWNLNKWIGHIQEKTGEETGYLRKTIQEHLGTDWEESLYIRTIDRNYYYNKETQRWQFEGEKEWIEMNS